MKTMIDYATITIKLKLSRGRGGEGGEMLELFIKKHI